MCLVTLLPKNIRNAHGELTRGISPDASDLGTEMNGAIPVLAQVRQHLGGIQWARICK
jgi:hypothetical protein